MIYCMFQGAARQIDTRHITPAESEELERLYSELPVIAAAEAADEGDHTGITSNRFKQLDDRVSAIMARIAEILG
jgi:hypothetical protein